MIQTAGRLLRSSHAITGFVGKQSDDIRDYARQQYVDPARQIEGTQPRGKTSKSQFFEARGIAQEVFRALDGGEAFLKAERDQFYGDPLTRHRNVDIL